MSDFCHIQEVPWQPRDADSRESCEFWMKPLANKPEVEQNQGTWQFITTTVLISTLNFFKA